MSETLFQTKAEMQTNISFPEHLTSMHPTEELQAMAVQGAVLLDYLRGNISMMKAADMLVLNYDEMTELLHNLKIPSMGNLPDDLRQELDHNREELAQQLGIA